MNAILMELMGHNNLHGGFHISQFVLPGRHDSLIDDQRELHPLQCAQNAESLASTSTALSPGMPLYSQEQAKANRLRCLKKVGYLNLDNRQVFWNMPYDSASLKQV
jgi:hypothetical protein